MSLPNTRDICLGNCYRTRDAEGLEQCVRGSLTGTGISRFGFMEDNNTQKTERWTIKSILEWTTGYFREKGIKTPRLDAEVLLAHALDTERLRLYLDFERPLSPDERNRFRELVRRRASREPVAYLVGKKEFWSVQIKTLPGVLIPRPETEVLVEVVLQKVRELPQPLIAEVGTGSGAVAVAILRENRQAVAIGTDVSIRCLEITRINARDSNTDDRLHLVASNLLAAIQPAGQFDVICSNPPYIPTGVITHLEPEVRDFEPHGALDGGADGLDVIRNLVDQAPVYLKRGGWLVIEFGDGQETSVEELMTHGDRFRDVSIHRDLSGTPRIAKGVR